MTKYITVPKFRALGYKIQDTHKCLEAWKRSLLVPVTLRACQDSGNLFGALWLCRSLEAWFDKGNTEFNLSFFPPLSCSRCKQRGVPLMSCPWPTVLWWTTRTSSLASKCALLLFKKDLFSNLDGGGMTFRFGKVNTAVWLTKLQCL